MSDTSPRLSLPFITPAQAQKHVTHNEALLRLDVVTQLTLADINQITPPVTPQEGQVWALSPAPQGEWEGQPNMLAAFANGAWLFIEPSIGWQAVNSSDNTILVWTGTIWEAPALIRLPE